MVLSLDEYYADQLGPGGRRVATQTAKQLAEPRPENLSGVDLAAYHELDRRWQDWTAVMDGCRQVAVGVLDRVAEIHRHLDYPAATAARELPLVAVVDILDRGDLDDWRPLAAAVARDPHGCVAERIADLVNRYPMYGTSPL